MSRRGLIALGLLTAALVWGCGSKEPRPQTAARPAENTVSAFQARDDFGQMVTLARPPRRIICLAPNVVEIAYALGLGDRIVGVSEFCDFPAEAKTKPVVGRYDRPSIEKIVSLQPDLVLLGYGNPKELAAALKKAGVEVFGVNPKSIEEIFEVTERIGKVCGAEAEARHTYGGQAGQVVEGLRTRLAKVKERLPSGKARRLQTFIVVDEESLWTAGRDTLQEEILRLAGGENIASFRASYFPISKEVLLEAQPEVILVAGKPSEASRIRRRFQARADLAGLKAVREGNILVMDGDILSRPGPRVVDAVEQLSSLLSEIRTEAGLKPALP